MARHPDPNKPDRTGPSPRSLWHDTDYGSVVKVLLAIGATALPFVLWVLLG
jgi:hypothetical protein